MRWMAILLVVSSVGLLGCSDSTDPDPDPASPSYGTIQYHGEAYQFDTVEGHVSGTDGGPPTYSLSLRFSDPEGRSIRFRVQDPENNPSNLVTLGAHPATGGHWDGVSSYMQPASFTIGYLGADSLSVTWEEIDRQDRVFSGRGFIEIFQRLDLACADSIWSDGEFVHPGDPAYDQYHENYCEPGYFFPAQRVWFEIEDGAYSP